MHPCIPALLVMSGWLAADIPAQEPHTYQLPAHIAPLLTGTYTIERATSSGSTELTVALVEGALQLGAGAAGNRMIAERMTHEPAAGNNGVPSEIYIFTVVNRPGVVVRFWLAGKAVTRISYAEDFSKPPIMTVGRRKPGQDDRQAADAAAAWRTSFDEFVRAIAAFPIQEIPDTNPNGADLTGLRVGPGEAVMKRFGGPVEFTGTFQGVSRDFDSVRARPTNRERVEIEMVYPAVPGPTNWTLLLYPKATALGAWKAVAPQTLVRFRATVTGIARHRTFLSGVDLRWYSILLEEATMVAMVNESPDIR